MFNNFSEKFNSFNSYVSPVQELINDLSQEKSVRIFVKRDDLIHPLIMGNKWRKLKYNLLASKSQGIDTLLTFGGAYSNHIIATAGAGSFFGFKTIGIIRGEELSPTSNQRLAAVSEWGMDLRFMDRQTYKKRNDPDFHIHLRETFGDIYIIPEGGNNELALKGATEIVDELPDTYNYYCCSCGTGNTAAGFAKAIPLGSELIVFPSLNQIEEQKLFVASAGGALGKFGFNTDYVFGGYAKTDLRLEAFRDAFPLVLDPVYTSKLFFGVYDLLKKDYFAKNSSVLIYHSGGYSLD